MYKSQRFVFPTCIYMYFVLSSLVLIKCKVKKSYIDCFSDSRFPFSASNSCDFPSPTAHPIVFFILIHMTNLVLVIINWCLVVFSALNSCALGFSYCHPDATCVYLNGKFGCECKIGYNGLHTDQGAYEIVIYKYRVIKLV